MTSCLVICVVCMYNSPNPNLVMSLPPHCEQTRTSLGVFNSLPRRLRASLSRSPSPSRSLQFHLLRLSPLMILHVVPLSLSLSVPAGDRTPHLQSVVPAVSRPRLAAARTTHMDSFCVSCKDCSFIMRASQRRWMDMICIFTRLYLTLHNDLTETRTGPIRETHRENI